MLEESLEGRLEKEKNLAVIESARSEQSMLRKADKALEEDGCIFREKEGSRSFEAGCGWVG